MITNFDFFPLSSPKMHPELKSPKVLLKLYFLHKNKSKNTILIYLNKLNQNNKAIKKCLLYFCLYVCLSILLRVFKFY